MWRSLQDRALSLSVIFVLWMFGTSAPWSEVLLLVLSVPVYTYGALVGGWALVICITDGQIWRIPVIVAGSIFLVGCQVLICKRLLSFMFFYVILRV